MQFVVQSPEHFTIYYLCFRKFNCQCFSIKMAIKEDVHIIPSIVGWGCKMQHNVLFLDKAAAAAWSRGNNKWYIVEHLNDLNVPKASFNLTEKVWCFYDDYDDDDYEKDDNNDSRGGSLDVVSGVFFGESLNMFFWNWLFYDLFHSVFHRLQTKEMCISHQLEITPPVYYYIF